MEIFLCWWFVHSGGGLNPLRVLQRAQSRAPVSSVTAWAHRHDQTQVTLSSLGALSKNSPLLSLNCIIHKTKQNSGVFRLKHHPCYKKQQSKAGTDEAQSSCCSPLAERVGCLAGSCGKQSSFSPTPSHPPQRPTLPLSAPKPSKHFLDLSP